MSKRLGGVPALLAVALIVPAAAGAGERRLPEKLGPKEVSITLPPGGVDPTGVTSDASPQPGDGWQGTTPGVASGILGNYDLREFEVLAGFDNDLLTLTITWTRGSTDVIYDLDLYLDGFNATTLTWEELLSSGGSQTIAGNEAAIESIRYATPEPGKYRARVSNFANSGQTYTGTISFTSVPDPDPLAARATVDRPDESSLPRAHVIYFVPKDKTDEMLDTNGILRDSILSLNQWWSSQTGGMHIRLDNYTSDGVSKLDITFVRGNQLNSKYSFSSLVRELDARGFASPPSRKRYIVFAAVGNFASGACGTAFYTTDEGYAQWAVTFLDSPAGCKARTFGTPANGPSFSETITAQEFLHNEGLAPVRAPHHCAANLGHLCTGQALSLLGSRDPESFDALFPFVGRPLSQKKLDIDHDDYYLHPWPHRDYKNSPFLEG